jgi:DNA-binding transcriptional LysR family regulator
VVRRAAEEVVMQMRHLEYLDALAHAQHFGRAASACNVSQPGLSAGIRKLEADVGAQIVKRGRRFNGFTPEGERVLHTARRIIAERAALHQDLTNIKGAMSGTLRIGAIPTALAALSLLTKPFCEEHPLVRLAAYSLSSEEIVQRLSEFELDVGITYVDREPLGAVRTVPLFEERFLLLTRRNSAIGRQKSVAWSQLRDLDLCLLSANMQNRRILQRNFHDAGITVAPKLESDTVSVLYDHVSAHGWSTIITDAWLKVLGVPKGMCAVPMDKPRHSFRVGLVLADREPVPMLATALVDVAQRAQFADPAHPDDS